MSDFSYLSLEDLVVDIIDRRGVTPRKLGGDFSPEGYRVISARTIRNRTVDLTADDERYVSDEMYRRWMKTPLREGDVLLTSEAPLGEPAYVHEAHPWVVGQRLFAIRTDSKKIMGRFLFYAVQSHAVREDLISRATGTTVLGIRQSELRRVRIPVPSLAEQGAIVEILGTIDDKIELNRRMSETLESIARIEFLSRFSTISSNSAVPAGWVQESLGDHVLTQRGLSYSGAGLAEAGVPLLNLNSILEGGGYKPEGLKFYVGNWKPRHKAKPGDLLVANTEQGFNHLLIGYAALTPTYLGEEAIYSHHLYKVRPRTGSPLTSKWLLYALNASPVGDLVRRYSNGTTVNMLPPDAFVTPKFNVPSAPEIRAFDDWVEPQLVRRESLYKESLTLQSLRDTLLPKLISGELRVPKAEQLVSEVA